MKLYIALGVGFVAALLLLSSVYVVSEMEQVIITRFGRPVGDAIAEPGPKFKIPIVDTVNRFDKRWLEWDGSPEEMPTREKTYILVDAYARWRINDPLRFFTSVVNERGAQTRLDDIIGSETRNVIAAHNLIEVVRSSSRRLSHLEQPGGAAAEGLPAAAAPVETGREKITQLIREKAARAVPEYGIELVDVQFQRVNYTDSVRKKVFERMVSERKRIAARYRSEGEGKKAEILGKKERELKGIESGAYRRVQQIKGKADAEATTIYAEAHNLDPRLYRLVKSLETYRETVDEDTVMLMSTDSDYFEQLVSMNPGKKGARTASR